jgi:hypothetical protein
MSADGHQDTEGEPLVMSLRTSLFVGEAGVAAAPPDGRTAVVAVGGERMRLCLSG